jgi:CDP-glucose 4,6-dehydratase
MTIAPSMPENRLGAFYRGRRVLVTGHTGLLGGWVTEFLGQCGAEAVGLTRGRMPDGSTGCRTVVADIRDADEVAAAFAEVRPAVVVHLAAQSSTRQGERRQTHEINVMGTVNVLEAAETASVAACVVAGSSRDPELRASDAALGNPYNASKFAVEHVVQDYRRAALASTPVRGVAVGRPAVLIGGGDRPSGRVIPDVMAALRRGERPALRTATAYRPWQHAVEAASGLLWLAASLATRPDLPSMAYNFGPGHHEPISVGTLAGRLTAGWNEEAVVGPGPGATDGFHLDHERARQDLGWVPCWDVDRALAATIAWHRADLAGQAAAVRAEQVGSYAVDAWSAGAAWAQRA